LTNIEKAFLHVKLYPSDRNFSRFPWPANMETPDEIISSKYRFVAVPFGYACSPFMLGAALNPSSLLLLHWMRDNVHVDNILSGCQTKGEILT